MPSGTTAHPLGHSWSNGSDKNLDLRAIGPLLHQRSPGHTDTPCFKIHPLHSFTASDVSNFSHWWGAEKLCSSVRKGLSPLGDSISMEY